VGAIDFSTEVGINRPAGAVFTFVSDVTNNPRWQNGMRSCVWTSPPPHGAGATYDQTARFLGRDIVSRFVVAEFDPGRMIRFKTTESPFPIDERRTVAPASETSSRIRVHLQGDASRVFRLFAPLLSGMVGRSVRRDYQRLKRLLEGAA
jgi:hypothetical protein